MRKLTFYDRQRIEFYSSFRSISRRDIAKLIGRNVSIVSRELKLHKLQFSPYNAELAQKAADRKARFTNKKKLDKCPKLKTYVESKLAEDWSPEQIAGLLMEHPPPELKRLTVKSVCPETIYQHIYDRVEQGGAGSKLYKHLRRRQPCRKPWGQRQPRKLPIPERIPISERPEAINQKQGYGNFEIDMLCGQKSKEAVSTHYERKSMYLVLHKLNSKDALSTTEATNATCEMLPPEFVKSMTYDNGGENAGHRTMRYRYGIDTYFCEPFKPWQKGGVENANGLIRQYIPKGTDMKTIDQTYLDTIQSKLNNRPRKTLNYLTPSEVINNVINTKCCTKF